jgi:hypothetical protein
MACVVLIPVAIAILGMLAAIAIPNFVKGRNQALAHRQEEVAKQIAMNTPADPRLETKVSYATEKASVQDIVRSLAEQAGLQYDFQKSFAQTDPVCRRWVEGVAIRDKSCRDALEEILGPVGLRYQVENGTIALYRK